MSTTKLTSTPLPHEANVQKARHTPTSASQRRGQHRYIRHLTGNGTRKTPPSENQPTRLARHRSAGSVTGLATLLGIPACQDPTRGPTDATEPALSDLRSLAEQGNVEAQAELGAACLSSENIPQHAAKAAKWYLRAANQGHARAQATIATCI